MKPIYDPKLNALSGKKGGVDGLIVSGAAVAAAGVTKLLMDEQNAAVENIIATLIASAAGALVGYLKRRYFNWRKNK